jgi:hypothetical protein
MAYLTQRGMGSYDQVGDRTWEYYPPPYDFLAPRDSVAIPAPILYTPGGGLSGLGGCGCGGTCGGCGDHSHGMGLFDTGLDMSGWGLPEYGVLAGAAFLVYSLVSGGRKARKSSRARKSKALMDRVMF